MLLPEPYYSACNFYLESMSYAYKPTLADDDDSQQNT
jgi:hypothetical protein